MKPTIKRLRKRRRFFYAQTERGKDEHNKFCDFRFPKGSKPYPMKKVIFASLVSVLLAPHSWSQIISHTNPIGNYEQNVFGIARLEAMGGTGITESNSAAYQVLNPALLGDVKGIDVIGGLSNFFLQPNGYGTKSAFIGLKLIKRTFVGGYAQIRDYGYYTYNGETNKFQLKDYGISVARNFVENAKHKLDGGVNWHYSDVVLGPVSSSKAFFFDLGLRYKLKFSDTHHASAGLVIGNFLNGKRTENTFNGAVVSYPYSSQMTIGFSDHYAFKKQITSKQLTLLQGTLSAEFSDQLSLRNSFGLRSGLELKLFDMIALRCGYYEINRINRYSDVSAESKTFSMTYGAGIELPFEKLTKKSLPLLVGLDYCRNEYPRSKPQLYSVYEIRPAVYWNLRLIWNFRNNQATK